MSWFGVADFRGQPVRAEDAYELASGFDAVEDLLAPGTPGRDVFPVYPGVKPGVF